MLRQNEGPWAMSDAISEKVTVDVLGLTAQIVAAYAAKDQLAADALPSLIQAVYRSLAAAGEIIAKKDAQVPAVSVRKSVFPDFIVCLEDGKQFKTLKRHLKNRYNLTPDEYRAKWRLPHDYPMVAPSYASQRSTIAKKLGLGRKHVSTNPAAAITEPMVTLIPARRARGSKG